MEAPPSFQPPPNGQPQRQKRSPRNNKQQQWRKNSHNHNNSGNKHHRIPPQQPGQKNFKKRRSNGQRGGQTELGFFGSVPSLQDLQRENRKRTRRHYGNNNNNNQQRGAFVTSAQLPILTNPPPPYFPSYLSHDNNEPKLPWLSLTGFIYRPPQAPTPARFPGASPANPLATPIIPATQDGAADKLEAEGLHAGLDFFATNDGLVLYNDTPAPSNWSEEDDDHEHEGEMDSHSLSGSEDDENDGDDDGDARGHRGRLRGRAAGSTLAGNGFGVGGGGGAPGGAHGRIIQRLRDKVAQQDAYIAELEDENLRYRERLDLFMHQLREMQEGGGGGAAADVEKNDETSKEQEPTAGAGVADVGIIKNNDNAASEMNESPAVKA